MEIKFENVSYYYSKQENEILKDINIQFSTGKIIGIVGPIGSGKTTLLELIKGIKLPRSGNIKIGDLTINKRGISDGVENFFSIIGYLPQFPENNFLYDTVQKEMSYTLEKCNYNPQKRKKHIEQALTMVGLDISYLSRYPFTLSSGEIRKLELAKILACNPKVLLLDEPIMGMDCSDKKKLITILSTIKARYQKTVIIVSNDIDFLNKIADEIVVLKNGNVLVSGEKRKVFKNCELLASENIPLPKVTKFENYVLEKKKVQLGHRTEVNDLVKDILRSLQ